MENFPKWVFENYPTGQLQDMITILKEMSSHNCTAAELIAYSDEFFSSLKNRYQEIHKIHRKRMADLKAGTRRCPDCGNYLALVEVNDRPCSKVDGNFKSLWYCMDGMGCGYEKYSETSYEKELAAQVKEFPPGGYKDEMKRRLRRASLRLAPRNLRLQKRRSKPKASTAPPAPSKPCGGK